MSEQNLESKTVLLSPSFDTESTTLTEAKQLIEKSLRAQGNKIQKPLGATDSILLHLGDESQPLGTGGKGEFAGSRVGSARVGSARAGSARSGNTEEVECTLARLGIEKGRTLFVQFWIDTSVADDNADTGKKRGPLGDGTAPSLEVYLKTGGILYRCPLCDNTYCTCLENLPLPEPTDADTPTKSAQGKEEPTVKLPVLPNSARGNARPELKLPPAILSARGASTKKGVTAADLKTGKLKPFSLPIPKALQLEPTHVKSLTPRREAPKEVLSPITRLAGGGGGTAEFGFLHSDSVAAETAAQAAAASAAQNAKMESILVKTSGGARLPKPTVMTPKQQSGTFSGRGARGNRVVG